MLRVYQKRIKVRKKVYHILYILKGNKVFYKLGYIMPVGDCTIIRVNLKLLYNLLYSYGGILKISDKIYLKMFLLFYFYLLNHKKYNKLNINNENNNNNLKKNKKI